MEVSQTRELIRHHSHSDLPRAQSERAQWSTPRRGPSPARSEGTRQHTFTLEDLKLRMTRLKHELDIERARNQQLAVVRMQDFQHIQAAFRHEQEKEVAVLTEKLQKENEKQLETIKESAVHEKDAELSQVLRYKEEELRHLRNQFDQEKEESVKIALQLQKIALKKQHEIDPTKTAEKTIKLESELGVLRMKCKEIEEKYQKKCKDDETKERELKKMKANWESCNALQETNPPILTTSKQLNSAESLQTTYEECINIKMEDSLTQNEFKSEQNEKSAVKTGSLPVIQCNEKQPAQPLSSECQPISLDDDYGENQEDGEEYTEPVIDPQVDQLHRQVARLEKRIDALKRENEDVKSKQSDQKPLEDKIKSLKRRNAELANMARRLEEKAKTLQQENHKKSKERPPGQDVEQLKRMFARQRARDLAEYAKNMLSRDKEIEELRTKCQDFANQLGSQDASMPENGQLYGEKEELVNIVKQSAKERLLLEQQVARSKPESEAQHKAVLEAREQIRSLQEGNENLQQELDQLQALINSRAHLENTLSEQTEECVKLNVEIVRLNETLKTERQRIQQLELQLHESNEKNIELTFQVTDLHRRVQESEQVHEECESLKQSLSEIQVECSSAKDNASLLQTQVHQLENECSTAQETTSSLKGDVDSLETLVKHLHECAEDHEQLKDEHKTVLDKLKSKDEKLIMVQKEREVWKCHQDEALDESQRKLATLTDELGRLQTELEQQRDKYGQDAILASSESFKSTSRDSSGAIDWLSRSQTKSSESGFVDDDRPTTGGDTSPQVLDTDTVLCQSNSKPHVPARYIDDRTGSPNTESDISKTFDHVAIQKPKSNIVDVDAVIPSYSAVKIDLDTDSDSDIKEKFVTSACLFISENNNGELNNTDNVSGVIPYLDTSLSGPGIDPELDTISQRLRELEAEAEAEADRSQLDAETLEANLVIVEQEDPAASHTTTVLEESGDNCAIGEGLVTQQDLVVVVDGSGDGDRLQHTENTAPSSVVTDSFLSTRTEKMENGVISPSSRLLKSLPGGKKSVLQVFIAKYSYDPIEYSPNDNPEAELLIAAGDYILVHGDMDEDGFFEGELMDGRRGLVPSNFVEKVAEDDLSEFHALLTMAGPRSEEDSILGGSRHRDLDFNSSDESEKIASEVPVSPGKDRKLPPNLILHEEKEQISSPSTVKVSFSHLESKTQSIPFPTKLKLDRQLMSSVMISWLPPEGAQTFAIHTYHIYMDNRLCTTVQASERTKALVENVDTSKVQRVSVTAVNKNDESERSSCSILIGKEAIPKPTDLNISNISPNYALLMWLPGNSNYRHVVTVNGCTVATIACGVHRYPLTELKSGTRHHVTVQAKAHKSDYDNNQNKSKPDLLASIDFHTPHDTSLEPPISVQIETGPQVGTILLTWLPVTISTSGESQDALLSGYVIYADGEAIKQVLGPTNDHVLLSLTDFHGIIPNLMTVRTLSQDGIESCDSHSAPLPSGLVKEMSTSTPKTPKQGFESDTDDEIEAAFRDGNKPDTLLLPEYLSAADSSNSELSDIQEEEEEDDDGIAQQQKLSQGFNPLDMSKADMHLRGIGPSSEGRGQSNLVPSIEITRDSGSDRGSSFDIPEDDNSPDSDSSKTFQKQSVTPPADCSSPHTNYYGTTVVSKSSKHIREMDSRDGYRELKKSENKDSVIDNNEHDKLLKESSLRHNNDISNKTKHKHTGDSDSVHSEAIPDRTANITDSYKKTYGSLNDTSTDHMNQSSESSSIQELVSNDVITKKRIRDDIPDSDLIDYEDNGEGDSMLETSDIMDDGQIRLFIALFDYNPLIMSPNVDAADEELPFKEGQLIKIFGDKDTDGFYRGECGGRQGYVPCNMISEVQVDDPEVAAQLLRESQGGPITEVPISPHATRESYHNGYERGHGPTEDGSRKMMAVYDYDPQELSPNVDAEVELPFKIGDVVVVYGDMDEDGFYLGELNGLRGLVPSNFLQAISPSSDMAGHHNHDDEEVSATEYSPPQQSQKDRIAVESPLVMSDHNTQSPELISSEDDKRPTKKKGLFSKGRNILKKLSR